MKQHTKIINEVLISDNHHDFGCNDKRGRRMGTRIIIKSFDAVPQDADKDYGWLIEPGHYFRLSFQVTRDGERYGASNSGKLFKTQAEADGAAIAYLSGARKRAGANAYSN